MKKIQTYHVEIIQEFTIKADSKANAMLYLEEGMMYKSPEYNVRITDMNVRELVEIDKDITVDVYETLCDEIGVAFVSNNTKLTDKGEKHFAPILELLVEIDEDENCCSVQNDDEKNIPLLKELFWGLAGYMDKKTYDKYFTTANPLEGDK